MGSTSSSGSRTWTHVVQETVQANRYVPLPADIETVVGTDHPLSGEKIAPILNLFRVPDVEAAFALTECILAYEGAGHSANIQTTDPERARRAGEAIDIARLLVNQPNALANGGHYRNGLTSTLSEGTGTWGGNQLDENIGVEKFYQTTTVSRPIEDATPPDAEALFAPSIGRDTVVVW